MRIFIAVRHSVDPRYFYGGLWHANFCPALRQLGHELVVSQVDLLAASRFMEIAADFNPQELQVRATITDRILEEVKAALVSGPIDLFLSYFYNSHFDPDGFNELRRLGIPSVNFYCNSIHQFSLVSLVSSKVDFAWHAERDARESYVNVGANPVWIQMGADPVLYHPVAGKQRQKKAVFVGQRYGDRDRCLAALVRESIPVEIYGSGWKADEPSSDNQLNEKYLGRRAVRPASVSSYSRHIVKQLRSEGLLEGIRRLRNQLAYRRESVSIANVVGPNVRGKAADISDVFAEYEVCLNFSNVWSDGQPGSRLIPHVRLRDFEGPMCRTCYLTGYSEEITEFYKIGREIDTYTTTEELVDKTQYYLEHPSAAEKLRDAGYHRALRDHTWKRRFEELFCKLEMNKTIQPIQTTG